MDDNKYISTSQAAARLDTHVTTIQRYLREGKLRGIKVGDRPNSPWIVDAKSVERHRQQLQAA